MAENLNVSGIYFIRNQVNGKYYIGSAVNIRKRWTEHRRTLRLGTHHSRTLQRAWSKYGEDEFDFHLVEIVEEKDELISREQWWMDVLEPSKSANGYNIHPVARSALGSKRTEEFKAKFRESRKGFGKGKKISSEHKAALLEGRRRAGVSDETRAKMSKAARQRSRTPCKEETKLKIGAANSGRKFPPVTDETRRKLSEAAKADWARRKLLNSD